MAKTKWTRKKLAEDLNLRTEDTAKSVLIDIICDLYFAIKEGVANGDRVEGYIREMHILLDDLLATPKSKSTDKRKVSSSLDDKFKKELERIIGEDDNAKES